MSDEDISVSMVCATKIMNPGELRIGRIGREWTLPRTVPLKAIIAVGIGAGLGVLLGLAFGGQAWLVTTTIGGGLGWAVVSYSPLRNESLMKWVELKIKNRTRTRIIDGKRVITSVGGAVVTAPIMGAVTLRRSAVRVHAGQFDERGVARSVRNRNLDELAPLYGNGHVPEGALRLPTDDAKPKTLSRRGR